jgi:hypothetical protein
MLEPPRRIVTGHDATGKSVFLSDAPKLPFPDAPVHAKYYEIWNTTRDPEIIEAAPQREPTDRPRTTGPGANGSVIRIIDFLPGFTPQHRRDPTRPGMHRTETIDYAICLQGEIWALLDDSETCMKPGDILVQRGTDHAWRNRSQDICRMAFVLVSGQFDDSLKSLLNLKTLVD